MPKLEARFHPWPASDEGYVVVGYVIWDATGGERPQVQPAPSLRDARAPRAILATLRHLVNTCATGYAQLTDLQTRFWSFVPAEEPEPPSPPLAA
jgi:hypothetical protein